MDHIAILHAAIHVFLDVMEYVIVVVVPDVILVVLMGAILLVVDVLATVEENVKAVDLDALVVVVVDLDVVTHVMEIAGDALIAEGVLDALAVVMIVLENVADVDLDVQDAPDVDLDALVLVMDVIPIVMEVAAMVVLVAVDVVNHVHLVVVQDVLLTVGLDVRLGV